MDKEMRLIKAMIVPETTTLRCLAGLEGIIATLAGCSLFIALASLSTFSSLKHYSLVREAVLKLRPTWSYFPPVSSILLA